MRGGSIIERSKVTRSKDPGQFMELVAGLPVPPVFWQKGARLQPGSVPRLGGNVGNRGGCTATQASGHPANHLPDALAPNMAVVTAEDFVPAVAGKANGNVLAGQLREEIGWDLRIVGKRLIINCGQARDDLQSLFRGDVEFGVRGSQMLCERECLLGFVVAGVSIADC